MTWILAIALAIATFAVAAFVLRIGRSGWTTFAAALALGLAGYALLASPDVPAAPKTSVRTDEQGAWALVDERKLFFGAGRASSDKMIIADALARHGQYANAAAMLRGAVTDNPRDAEAWLALGNALVEHADGALTPPALLAYRRAAETDPKGIGPGYFLGLAFIRQGQLAQARSIWAGTLEGAAPDAVGREVLGMRLARLDTLLKGDGPIRIPQQ